MGKATGTTVARRVSVDQITEWRSVEIGGLAEPPGVSPQLHPIKLQP